MPKGKPVIAQNRVFQSVTEFCLEYGLKYPTVNLLIRKGLTGDEILNRPGNLKGRSLQKENSDPKYSFDGVDYPSLAVAAETLGISLDKITSLQKKNGMSANEAIAVIMQEKDIQTSLPRRPKHTGAITVAGVTYASMQEALLAYGMQYITVKSRMEREGISFEEALCRGKKERRQILPYKSDIQYRNFYNENDIASAYTPFELPEDKKDIFVQLCGILSSSTYKPAAYYAPDSRSGLICFYEQLHAIRDRRLITLTFNYPQNYYPLNIEIAIPNLLKVSTPEPNIKLLTKLNELNGKYLGAVATVNNGKIAVRWLYTLTSSALNTKQLMNVIYRFIGTAAAIFDELMGSS